LPTSPRILVIGAVNLDLVVEVNRLPFEGETLIGKRMTQAPGGKGANQAVAVAKLGGSASFCGRIGNDAWGKLVKDGLSQANVNTRALITDVERATGSAVILVEPTGKNQIIAVGGANLGVTATDVEEALKNLPHLDAMMLTLETPLETVQHAIALANERGLLVILDAAPPANYPLAALRGTTVLSPNETEAQALTSIKIETAHDARRAAELLRIGTQAKHVVMKLGERGALIHDDAGHRWIEPMHVHAIDTTACGDAFTAAMTMRLCAGDSIDDAVRYGSAAGAVTASKAGAQASLPSAAEVAALIAQQH